MPYTVSTEHHDFFAKHGFIELEALFPPALIEALYQDLLDKTSQGSFKAGHNLLCKEEQLLKRVFSRNFVDVLSALFRIKKPRLAYDQLLLSSALPPTQKKLLSFDELSAIGPLLGAIAIPLTAINSPEDADIPLPKGVGSAMFFNPKLAVSFEALSSHPNQALLLLGIGNDKLMYRRHLADPFVHDLKKEGLVFGDSLTSRTHPFLKTS